MNGPQLQALQQSLFQQQLMLQQTLQQHALQTKLLEAQVRALAGKDLDALKQALRDTQAETRWAAAWIAGQQGRPLQKELIDTLTDPDGSVRQAARQSLVQLATEAQGTGQRQLAGRSRVDFGPAPEAGKSAQAASARKWRNWWDARSGDRSSLQAVSTVAASPPALSKEAPSFSTSVTAESDAASLGKELVTAPESRQDDLVARLRDRKGVAYTEALAETIPQLSGPARGKAREALAERLARMTDSTLRRYLRDEDPELRRAAALACAMNEARARIPDLLLLLEDPSPAVRPAAEAALRSLTGQSFGSLAKADEAARSRVVTAWKDWWKKQPAP